MFIGLGLIALGFILMAGGGSDDPNVFNPEIFSAQRIRCGTHPYFNWVWNSDLRHS